MIGLRIGYGVLIRLGMRLIGPLRIIRQYCRCHRNPFFLRHLPRLRLRPLRDMRRPRLSPQSLLFPPVLAGTGQVVNEGFIDSSISSNSRSSGKKHSTLIVSKMVVGALLLTGAWLSDVAFNPWYTPLSAPVFSEAPLLSLSSPFRDEKIDTSGHIDRPIDQDRMVTLIVRQGSLQHVFNGFKWLSGSMLSSGSICEKAWCA